MVSNNKRSSTGVVRGLEDIVDFVKDVVTSISIICEREADVDNDIIHAHIEEMVDVHNTKPGC
jgi:hypothetical protein